MTLVAEPQPVAPVAEVVPPPPEPVVAPLEPETVAPVEADTSTPAMSPWLIGGVAALLAAIALLWWARRRRARDQYYDYYADTVPENYPDQEPAQPSISTGLGTGWSAEKPAMRTAPEPIAPEPINDVAAPVVPRPATAVETDISIHDPETADVDALIAASEPAAGRPWLEFAIRPLRAGTDAESAVVQFELIVGNTGSRPAEDVRIATWMSAAGSEREALGSQLLDDPPADAAISEITIAAGDGARLDVSIALPKAGLRETNAAVLPVVMADARYRLPDGGEGRTSASFAIGMSRGEGRALAPFPMDDPAGLHDDVEARLHGALERV